MTVKRFWSQSVWLLASHALSTVMNLCVTIYALRHWGPEYSGTIAQTQSLVALLAVFSTLGMETTLVRRLTKYPEQSGALLGSTFALRVIGASFLGLILIPTSMLLHFTSGDQIVLILLAWCATAIQSLIVHGFKFSANQEIGWLVAVQSTQTLLFSLLRIIALRQDVSIYGFQGTYVLEAAVGMLFMVSIFKHRFGDITLSWNRQLALEMLEESLPLATASFFITAFLKVDIIIVSMLLSTGEVGIYTAAMRIVETYMTAIAVLFSQSMIWLTDAHSDRAVYEERLASLFKYGVAVTAACLSFNAILGGVLFRLFLGPAYEDAVHLSNLLGFTLFATTAGTIRSFAFSLDGLNRYHVWSALLGLAVGIPLTIIMTAAAGLPGTALSLTISYMLSAVGSSFIFPALRPIARLQVLLPQRPMSTH